MEKEHKKDRDKGEREGKESVKQKEIEIERDRESERGRTREKAGGGVMGVEWDVTTCYIWKGSGYSKASLFQAVQEGSRALMRSHHGKYALCSLPLSRGVTDQEHGNGTLLSHRLILRKPPVFTMPMLMRT